MELLFQHEAIGKIENTYHEDYWVHGSFISNDAYFKYKNFLDAIVSEEGMDEKQYNQELFDENNWFVKSKDGLKGIWIPAIYYNDGEVSIRYR